MALDKSDPFSQLPRRSLFVRTGANAGANGANKPANAVRTGANTANSVRTGANVPAVNIPAVNAVVSELLARIAELEADNARLRKLVELKPIAASTDAETQDRGAARKAAAKERMAKLRAAKKAPR